MKTILIASLLLLSTAGFSGQWFCSGYFRSDNQPRHYHGGYGDTEGEAEVEATCYDPGAVQQEFSCAYYPHVDEPPMGPNGHEDAQWDPESL
ncbi:MAG: hypothetical protein AB7T49_17660 [Oligoflexales bacterium]